MKEKKTLQNNRRMRIIISLVTTVLVAVSTVVLLATLQPQQNTTQPGNEPGVSADQHTETLQKKADEAMKAGNPKAAIPIYEELRDEYRRLDLKSDTFNATAPSPDTVQAEQQLAMAEALAKQQDAMKPGVAPAPQSR